MLTGMHKLHTLRARELARNPTNPTPRAHVSTVIKSIKSVSRDTTRTHAHAHAQGGSEFLFA